LGIEEGSKEAMEFTYVIQNLITSTDKCTFFISSEIINDKEQWYFCSKPTKDSEAYNDSGKCDVYYTSQTGDKHHRGI
jgi:hypothetical protein